MWLNNILISKYYLTNEYIFIILDKNVKAKSLNMLRKTKSERIVDIVKLFEVSLFNLIKALQNI